MKTLEGIIVANKTQNTAIVVVTRRVAHPLYKKLLKKSKRYKTDTNNITISLGDRVRIAETRPMSKEKHFKILEVIKKSVGAVLELTEASVKKTKTAEGEVK